MSIKIDANGDLTWVDGDVLYSADQNDTIVAKGLKIYQSTVDTTTYTESTANPTTKITWTFTPPNDYTVVVGLKVISELKTTGDIAVFRIKASIPYRTSDGSVSLISVYSRTAQETGSTFREGFCLMGGNHTNSSGTEEGIMLGESTYTISVELWQNDGVNTASMRNTKLQVYCMQYGNIETNATEIT